MSNIQAFIGLAFFILIIVFWFLRELRSDLLRLEKTIRQMSMVQSRRSVTFMKIENELDALMQCAWVMADADPRTRVEIEELIRGRHNRLRTMISHGTGVSEHLRGIELPAEEDDPWFNEEAAELITPEADIWKKS